MKNASLIVVGTGIKFLSHVTVEVSAYIKQSDKILFLVNEPATREWILNNQPQAESLEFLYTKYALRKDCYQAITDYILEMVRQIQHVCVVLYGHPAVFAQPGLDAVKLARQEGFYAKLLPGISAEDCLFADLLIDPGSCGCYSFEATDFLLHKRKFDPRGQVILWQVDIIGVLTNPLIHNNKKGAQLLVKYLSNYYEPDHKIFLYEAAQYPILEPNIQSMQLIELPNANFSRISTLYIPPLQNDFYDTDVLKELNININDLIK
jgi:tetrapyrrole methylase family protein/MazG family protein